MDKKILQDYIDACELIRETEEDIQKMRSQEFLYDKVKGSNPDFPYQPQSFNISGIIENHFTKSDMEKEMRLLQQRKQNANHIKRKVEKWLITIPRECRGLSGTEYLSVYLGMMWQTSLEGMLQGTA